MTTEPSNVVHVGGVDLSKPLSDYEVEMIHSGLMLPTSTAIRRMAREIRMARGVANPDLI